MTTQYPSPGRQWRYQAYWESILKTEIKYKYKRKEEIMILTDLISEYEYVYDTLKSCNDYITSCNELINNFIADISQIVGSYYMKTSPTESDKEKIIDDIMGVFNTSYTHISKLVGLSYPFYASMSKLEEHKSNIFQLSLKVKNFLASGHAAIDAINTIIYEGVYGLKAENLLPSLISSLQRLINHYDALCQYYFQLKGLDELLENIPNTISEKYNRIELHSLKPSLDMDSFIDDVKNLSTFICQFELIMTPENGSCKIYTQRIESGSLRIVWGSNTIELSGISDIIKAISDGIRTFRLTSAEKRLKNEEARTSKLQNDEKELAIINSQIKAVARITGLSSEEPADVEKLQKLCLPLVRYLYSNPVGSIGGYKYDINNELKLITSVFDTIAEP